jgi:hypothetical protein
MDEAERFFADEPRALEIFRAVRRAAGDATVTVSKSQVGFRRGHPFAAAWRPSQYLSGDTAPLVLSLFLPSRTESGRFKEVVEPRPGRFTHHLELRSGAEVDAEVEEWLRLAREAAA